MQTQERHKKFSSGPGTHSASGEISVIHPKRSGRRSKKAPASLRVSGNGFLKQCFQSIPAYEIGYGLQFTKEEECKITGDISGYLVRSANACLEILQTGKSISSSGQLDKDCYTIHKVLKGHLPENMEMEFDFYKDQFSIFLQMPYKGSFPDYAFFFLPIAGVDKMGEALAAVFKKFVSYLSSTQKIPFPYTHWDFSALLEEWEPIDEEEDIDEELMDIAIEYKEGHIRDVMQEINGMDVSKEELLEELGQVDLLESYDLDLVDLMIEGINLMSTDCIMVYDCQDKNEFNRLFCLIWRDDRFVEAVSESMNTDLQEVEYTGPYMRSNVTPESRELIKETTYPTDFSDWWMRIFRVLERYE